MKLENNHNVYIPNMRDKYAMTFNGNKWNLTNKEEIISQLFDDKNDYLEDKFRILSEELDKITKKKFNRYLDNNEKEEIINKIKNEIKLILYNNKNIPIETRKK